jgi:hypothetical protein
MLALVLACGPLDWLRGNKDPKAVFMLLYGLCIASIALDDLTSIFVMGVAFAIGSAPGWSDSYGAIIEDRPMNQDRLTWWQKGLLEDKVWPAQIARGLLWALPCFVAAFFFGGWEVGLAILISHTIALPLAMKIKTKYHPWKVSEVLRGLLAGALCVILPIF